MIALLHTGRFGPVDLRIIKFSRFLGVELVPLRFNVDLEATTVAPDARSSVICTAPTLAAICRSGLPPGDLARQLRTFAQRLFVVGFEASSEHAGILRALTRDALTSVMPTCRPTSLYRVDGNSRHICRQFSGLDFEHRPDQPDATFVPADNDHFSRLITIDHQPFYVTAIDDDCQIFLSAAQDIPDLDAPIGVVDSENRATSPLGFFSTLGPLLMFLQVASPNGHWHNEAPLASFIIDDPLLQRRYGFVDYAELLRRMQAEHFSTSLAFIPWNHNRSDPAIVRLLAPHSETFSLCVHGCDHTWGEFGSADAAKLRSQARQALARMDRHYQRYGLKCDPVMVFPQGIFSSTALSALKATSYLAAVNSTPYPIDRDLLPLRALLEVAVTEDSRFPVLIRRKPHQIPELAFDLLLGRPALIVAHHDFFQSGYQRLSALVQSLHTMEPNLRWASLGTICSRTHLKRITAAGETQIRFLTDQFVYQNSSDHRQTVILLRHEPPPAASSAVIVTPPPTDISHSDDLLRLSVTLEPGETLSLSINATVTPADDSPPRTQLAYEASVFLRRRLSEWWASVSASWVWLVLKRAGLLK